MNLTKAIDPAHLQTQQIEDFAVVERLYKTRLKHDFPRNELKPLASMRRSWEKKAYDCYGLFCGDELLGYAFFVRLGSDYLFDYLAIEEHHRDEGFGSLFLRQLTACLSDANCVLLEVEDPDKAGDEPARVLRERRLQFYLRNGYLKTDLTSTIFGADYRILEVPPGSNHSADEIRDIYTKLYQSILPKLFFRTEFRVNEISKQTAKRRE